MKIVAGKLFISCRLSPEVALDTVETLTLFAVREGTLRAIPRGGSAQAVCCNIKARSGILQACAKNVTSDDNVHYATVSSVGLLGCFGS